ncbi:ABC transporter substrate-binding protein [Paraburkholderia tropica]|uniref:ABC transporter substrate-binding protein n=1 Tax=Paraburkholderia tropica TaxID=92647 RepID=UPI002AAFE620|nr:ABC transporter substrate-binding protein [Paraburkholderia tropica]
MTKTSTPSIDAIQQLAPIGALRAAINYGNPALARRDPATGELSGVSVDLATALGASLGVPVELVEFSSARSVVDGARENIWDIAFTGIDPERAKEMDYSTPYLLIEGVYMVRDGSSIRTNADVDQAGHRIAVSRASAYDLFLTREIKHAELVRGDDPTCIADMLNEQGLDVVAGVRARSELDAQRIGGLHLLEGNFMEIRQAMAIPKGRGEGARYLSVFIERMKASGFVADVLKLHHVDSGKVAPLIAV